MYYPARPACTELVEVSEDEGTYAAILIAS
jgi:hypothetical protein